MLGFGFLKLNLNLSTIYRKISSETQPNILNIPKRC